MNNRIVEFDLVRAICVLYIIGVWHLNEYLLPTYHYSGVILQILHMVTEAVLGTFTFVSGYFISKYEFNSFGDIFVFFKKRLLRFGLLLVISALSFSLLGWINLSQVFQIVLGINLFTTTPVPTLWFFSMIILFYIYTPLLRMRIHCSPINIISIRILVALLLFILMVVYTILNGSDYRVVLYFPFYYFGLNASRPELVGGGII